MVSGTVSVIEPKSIPKGMLFSCMMRKTVVEYSMLSTKTYKQTIIGVDADSPAARTGLKGGMQLVSVNGEPVRDLIDYIYLTDGPFLRIAAENDGRIVHFRIVKEDGEPLGLQFQTSLMSEMRSCKNHCIFCFIDQMPGGTRTSLHVKDDDWRMSFIMGNYVTLTNVSDDEFSRILARHVSPLYISVHATVPEVRVAMMRNPSAARLMDRLSALKQNGLSFHAQIVLCPGVNDGAVLERTLSDLLTLTPACRSVAIIPVGLTAFRQDLPALRGYTGEAAAAVIDSVSRWQKAFADKLGEPCLFFADEWYCMAQRELPQAEAYAEYPQIENGVGLLRRFEEELRYALADRCPRDVPCTVDMLGGTAAYPFFRQLYTELTPYGIEIRLHPIENRFFGGNVHVAGLVTAQDILSQLDGVALTDTLFVPSNMLREQEDVFLDNQTLSSVSDALKVRSIVFRDGEELINKLFEV